MIAERQYKTALEYNVNATKSFGYWVIKKYGKCHIIFNALNKRYRNVVTKFYQRFKKIAAFDLSPV